VETLLHWHEGARLNMEYKLYDSEERLACRAYSIQMMLDLSGRILLESPSFFRDVQERWRDGRLSFHNPGVCGHPAPSDERNAFQ
jgi:acyl-CoA thioesterase FadM